MTFPMNFIYAGPEYSTLTEFVPAPYFRKSFPVEKLPQKAELLICGLGFYELFVNGKRITRGLLSPYINNPDDLLYYDCYDLLPYLHAGENVIGVCLGNGLQNNPGGFTWGFDQARWRGAPRMALQLELTDCEGAVTAIESDQSFRTAPSPIYKDDLRSGEYYDARNELPGWCAPGYDDSDWAFAQPAPLPRGEAVLCGAEPIVAEREITPVSVEPFDGGYLYNFGENNTGLCRLKLKGEAGQEITMYFAERTVDGHLDRKSLMYPGHDNFQKDIYICKGEGEEIYEPYFTYHGFQYAWVLGLKPEQATEEALTYVVYHTNLPERGGFTCSDWRANRLQEMVRRSTVSNFLHFPVDCPHREKNGWTGDISLSAEHTVVNLEPDKNYHEWLRNARKAQNDIGQLPGIIPTGGWGYTWGNGAPWDNSLFYLPYMLYIYRHDKTVLRENAHAMLRYLDYMCTTIRPDGLISYGLGDWLPVGRQADDSKSPTEFVNTVLSMDICEKAAYMFGELGLEEQKQFALGIYGRLRKAGREHLIDFSTMTALGRCQTSQAMAIFYSLFEEAEKPEAIRRLVELVHEQGDHMDVGIVGAQVLFHVLSEGGYGELAYEMIVRPDFPSYGQWLEGDATTLREWVWTEDRDSLNHHFRGDISHWFIRRLAGIHYNPRRNGTELDIKPDFIKQLHSASGWHLAPEGKIAVSWSRTEEGILLTVEAPTALTGRIVLPNGYVFAQDGMAYRPLHSGSYAVKRATGWQK